MGEKTIDTFDIPEQKKPEKKEAAPAGQREKARPSLRPQRRVEMISAVISTNAFTAGSAPRNVRATLSP